MSKVMVTGAAGFIGQHLVRTLQADGEDVVCLDRRYTGLDFHDLGRRQHEDHLAHALNDVGRVYHLAAVADVREANADPDYAWRSNVEGTRELIDACRRAQVPEVVFTSSMAVWEKANRVTEEATAAPATWYGATKLAAEAALQGFAREEDSVTNVQIIRLGNVVGSGMTRYLLHDVLDKLGADADRLDMLGDGGNLRPFLHVDDAIAALRTLPIGEMVGVYNVASPDAISIRTAVDAICEALEVSPEIHWQTTEGGWHGDTRIGAPVVGKAIKAGWRPTMGAREAIAAAAVEAFRTES